MLILVIKCVNAFFERQHSEFGSRSFIGTGCSFDNRSSDNVVNYWTDFSKFYQVLTSWKRVEFSRQIIVRLEWGFRGYNFILYDVVQ